MHLYFTLQVRWRDNVVITRKEAPCALSYSLGLILHGKLPLEDYVTKCLVFLLCLP